MKHYDERMLGLLLDRYERSLLSENKNSRTIHISQALTKKEFSEYYDPASLEYEEIHRQLEGMEEKGLIDLVWRDKKKGHILEKALLREDALEMAYDRMKRTPRSEKRRKLAAILSDYEDRLPAFASWMKGRLAEGEGLQRYADENDPEKFRRVLTLTAAILENDSEEYLRSFSIRVFQDSKVAEGELNQACRILTQFERRDLPEDLETDEILQEFNIYRNPTYLFVKGEALSENLADGIGIFQRDLPVLLERLGRGEKKPDVILTIENLTSYHKWQPKAETLGRCEIVIYLAGYANSVKRHFLEALHQLFPEARLYHFGDIDGGGFRIWKNLCLSTRLAIKTIGMDRETWQHCRQNGRPLTENDKKTLTLMAKDPFFIEQKKLFESMISQNIKIEQECLSQDDLIRHKL